MPVFVRGTHIKICEPNKEISTNVYLLEIPLLLGEQEEMVSTPLWIGATFLCLETLLPIQVGFVMLSNSI